MADMFSRSERSRIMANVRARNTSLEVAVRRALWRRGLRYRIHVRRVAGTPDIANRSKRVAVFIDGCFWHGCPRCYSTPSTNRRFWIRKLESNKRRRAQVLRTLRRDNWTILQFWQCRVQKDLDGVVDRIEDALRKPRRAEQRA